MDFDNIEDLGIKLFEQVHEAYHAMEERERAPMMYLMCSIFGSMNYAPERAKDCDILLVIPPAMTADIKKEELEVHTYRGLPIEYKITSMMSLDVCEAIEVVSVIHDETKSFLRSVPTLSAPSKCAMNNFYVVAKNKMKDKSIVRREVSAKCSNSFVKAKKKLLVEKDFDPYISMKSLWHSIRMYEFASQFAKDGVVYDFEACNDLFDEIQRDYNEHSIEEMLGLITSKYKPIQNKAATKFKLYYPK